MSRSGLAVLTLLLAAATGTIASQNPGLDAPVRQGTKKAWEWTIDERIALRTDPDLARERVRRGRRVQTSSAQSANTELRPTVDSFDGRTHPELFLPYQVFDELIKLAFSGDPRTGQLIRDGFMPEVKRHGLPADFWDRLRSLSTVYVADFQALKDIGAGVRHQSGPARQRAEEVLALKHVDACRSRADVFAAARKEFGRERFDRFLYEVIAVNMFSVADRLPDPELLRQAEGGCR